MPLPDTVTRNIQGISIAGFRKDHQQLVFIRFGEPSGARKLITDLAKRTDSTWEVGRFNEIFSELRRRERHP